MLQQLRIIVVGCGLIGGSLLRALRPHVDELIAVDRDASTRRRLLEEGIANEATETLDSLSIGTDDLIILSVPVVAIIDLLERMPMLAPDGCLLLDLGSTKWDICRQMNALPGWFQAIGGHPMCGKELSGYAHSSAELFKGETFVLTPTVHTTGYLRAVALSLLQAIDAVPLIVPPKEHDQMVALISHLPYLLAATLIEQAHAESSETLWRLSASGFRDSSRLAG